MEHYNEAYHEFHEFQVLAKWIWISVKGPYFSEWKGESTYHGYRPYRLGLSHLKTMPN